VIAGAVAASTAVSVGPITPSVARACLRAHDHAVPPTAPRRLATLAVRSTVPGPCRHPQASGARGIQNP
jgi:hypothetical protein